MACRMPQRRTDLDALRSFAMLLGIALHASLSFFAFPWPVHDTQRSDLLPLFLVAIHGFRMPLFFLLSGYFTMLVSRRRGLKSLLEQRFTRIFLPLVIATATIMPLDMAIRRFAHRTIRPEPAIEEILSGDEAAVRQRLVTPGAIERKDPFYGRTPLGWAAMQGDPAIVAAVLDAGADVNECDGSGNTALHVVAYFGRDAAGRVLVERGAEGIDTRLGRHWKFLLPAAAVLLVVGIATMNDRTLAVVLQPAYAWTMALGLIGLSHRLFPYPRPAVSWLADASYWMYLVHVPLVMGAQLLIRHWPLSAELKFVVILATVTLLLLASYRWCVRYTPIGSLLNGPRASLARGQETD